MHLASVCVWTGKGLIYAALIMQAEKLFLKIVRDLQATMGNFTAVPGLRSDSLVSQYIKYIEIALNRLVIHQFKSWLVEGSV